jgi:hypothetical protein
VLEHRYNRIRKRRVKLANTYEPPEWNALEQWLTITGVAFIVVRLLFK